MEPKHPGRERAAKLIKSYAKGGKVHSDEREDRVLFKRMIAEHEKGEGEKTGGRIHGKKAHARMDKRARGGRVKKPAAVVNVMIGKPSGDTSSVMPMPAGPMPPAGPPMSPPGAMAGLPGPGGPPIIPRAHGGRVPHLGEAQKRTELMRKQMSNKEGYRKGGRVKSFPHMTAGAVTGEGRLEKIKAYGKNAGP